MTGSDELWKLVVSQGIGFTIMFLALKWLLKDRESAWKMAGEEAKARIALLEGISTNRTNELIALRSEFADYRKATQGDISQIYARHAQQIEGLQSEIRGLYKMMLEQKTCPVLVDSSGQPTH